MNAAITVASIPHRPPFLFVDDIVELTENRIVTTKFVDPAADVFRGHYPGAPVMPGVLLCECCLQSGALLLAHRLAAAGKVDGFPVVTRIKDARFKHIVRPGETLAVEVTLDDVLDQAFFLTGRVNVKQKSALRLMFTCTYVDGTALAT